MSIHYRFYVATGRPHYYPVQVENTFQQIQTPHFVSLIKFGRLCLVTRVIAEGYVTQLGRL